METKTSTTKLLPQQQCTYAAELKKRENKGTRRIPGTGC